MGFSLIFSMLLFVKKKKKSVFSLYKKHLPSFKNKGELHLWVAEKSKDVQCTISLKEGKQQNVLHLAFQLHSYILLFKLQVGG